MADSQSTVRKVDWNELLPWLILFRSVRIALMARVLILGAIGLIVTTLGWRLIGSLFGTADPVVNNWRVATRDWLWNDSGFATNLDARRTSDVFASASDDLARVPADVWLFLTGPFRNMFDADLTAGGFLCMLLAVLWLLLVWGIVGGAIARIAALKYTRDEAPGFVAALRHSIGKLPSYSFGPLVALAGAGVFSIQLVLLGLLMNVPMLDVVAALVWPFVLVLGLLMAILLLGALVGWPLMWATVAVEGTDAFDALSRSYAYTYQRPWRLMWYVAFSVFLAAISMFVVKAFAISAVGLGDWSIDWGLRDDKASQILGRPSAVGPAALTDAPILPPPSATTNAPLLAPPLQPTAPGDVTLPPPDATSGLSSSALPDPVVTDLTPTESWNIRAARTLITFWQSLWKSLAAGYQAAYIWVSAVGIYLLLRRDIDGAELDEVFVEHAEEHGLPFLEDDTLTGVPAVNPDRPAQPADPGNAAQAPPSMI